MKQIQSVTLRSGVTIGQGHPCFVVAEIGNNHQGDFLVARQMIDEAAAAGVQGVKFQKRDMEALLTREGRAAPYTGCNSFGPTYGEHRNALELSIEQMGQLKEYSESLGLVFFASAWDEPSLRQVLGLDVELLKICSADLVNVPLVRKYAATGIPIILSTGMSSLEDIDVALAEIRAYHDDVVLLHCNSTYPCPEEKIGLPVMEGLRERYGLPVGYSGHEQGIGPSVAAVALGACVVERHFTLDKTLKGTDHQASLEPEELARMVGMIQEVEKAMRVKGKKVFPEEQAAAKKLRKCIVFSRDLPAGHVLTESDLTTRSPRVGVSPVHWDEVLGATLGRSVKHEEPVQWDTLRLLAEECVGAASS
ncbi:MAG: N-acetylneuraminate synthase family protein [Pseudodesulfovibrio sp.]|uniref:N-acetylneuraminate synthase n=1 Tax=Pseudodesulfovibrio aespoeensis (strain ATCC 700646 / DSM 10631 / Aspo-2) TaxID=643562 RepID=E6VZ92_PSEA9|nr:MULTISPECIES: N-acetylneuraminate synthase family protein [Pseudodesulfovibrio]MBU4379265.1 N-acetylneuraminate synthase family protein [Pseudomonadota bacterium]ADU63964.1 N-acetylneuraminate synthase [Pseudodesulfovibrio aespoeensis Aspo-2]MBU4474368.1 N-acetylneuraminate synthase family protein [Pseudomonadota bacterium]MBU4517012.1 N-acetylneuraminate synthase family protein [Pseudomonadota bacterium]MBU4523263.1 N-acetylneuraminate synthase family protein [Pseudomonadota bacterium]